jgi:hypothetical protein
MTADEEVLNGEPLACGSELHALIALAMPPALGH